jgi:hypothetical protein
MRFNRFPSFGRELRRPFEVHENCYDCVEFYDGCRAWRASREFACANYYRLPDVMPGTHGQVLPPSRMQGRKKPRVTTATILEGLTRATATPSRPPLQPSPITHRGLGGERLCECGAVLPKRKRCCHDCRQKRREETMRHRKSRQRLSTAVDAGSGMLFSAPAGPSGQGRSVAHS